MRDLGQQHLNARRICSDNVARSEAATAITHARSLPHSQPADCHSVTGFFARQRHGLPDAERFWLKRLVEIEVSQLASPKESVANLAKESLLKLTKCGFCVFAQLGELLDEFFFACRDFDGCDHVNGYSEVTTIR